MCIHVHSIVVSVSNKQICINVHPCVIKYKNYSVSANSLFLVRFLEETRQNMWHDCCTSFRIVGTGFF